MVAAGQVVENLLDFGYEPAQEGPTGLAATQVLQEPAAKSILSGTSTNPLDDLRVGPASPYCLRRLGTRRRMRRKRAYMRT